MWKLTFFHNGLWRIYDIDFTDDCSAHYFAGTTKEGNRIIWSGEYLLEKIPEEALTEQPN